MSRRRKTSLIPRWADRLLSGRHSQPKLPAQHQPTPSSATRDGNGDGSGGGVQREPAGGAGLAEQGRQRVADDGGDAGGAAEHAGPGGPLRQHRQEEVGRQLGLHGALRLRRRPHRLGPRRLPHGLRRPPPPLLGEGSAGARPELPRRPGQHAQQPPLPQGRHRGDAHDDAVLPHGHAGLLRVHVRRHHHHLARRLCSGANEHQGLDGLRAALARLLLHRRRFQPLGRRVPLPVGRHRLLRRIRHPPLLWCRRLHGRLLGRAEAEGRQGEVLPQQRAAHARRSRPAVDGLVRLQRRRAIRGQHRLLRRRPQHQHLRRHQPPRLDLPRRRLLRQALRHRRRPGDDDGPRLHHSRGWSCARMGGDRDGHPLRQHPLVHHDDPPQEVRPLAEGGRHAGGVPHARGGGAAGGRPDGAPRRDQALRDDPPGEECQGRVLRRRRRAAAQAARRRGIRRRLERRRHDGDTLRDKAVHPAAHARRAADDRRRRGARRGGIRPVGGR